MITRKLDETATLLEITIPVSFRRRSARKLMIVPEGADYAPPPEQDQHLIQTLAKAFLLQEKVRASKPASLTTFAQENNEDPTTVCDLLRLTRLAPDIITRILNGSQPRDLTLRKLTNPLPLSWQKQREKLGFPQPEQPTS